jgi:hypothetical protein
MFEGTATQCNIYSNTGQYGGGAVWATLRDCLIYGNEATSQGGGARFSDLYNCTVVRNSAFDGGGVSYGTLDNCILWGNTGTTNPNWSGVGSVAHCCTTPLPPGDGNITNDPAFADAPSGNYRLMPGSPCIDAGTNAAVMTAADLDGNARIVFGTVDMGAYEYVVSTNDYDGDGLSNADESVAGTDRTDPDSRLAFIDTVSTGGLELVWIGGTSVVQIIEYRTNLASTVEEWTAIHTNAPVMPVTNRWTVPLGPVRARFYRIRVAEE